MYFNGRKHRQADKPFSYRNTKFRAANAFQPFYWNTVAHSLLPSDGEISSAVKSKVLSKAEIEEELQRIGASPKGGQLENEDLIAFIDQGMSLTRIAEITHKPKQVIYAKIKILKLEKKL